MIVGTTELNTEHRAGVCDYSFGDEDGQFRGPNEIAQDRTGSLYVTDSRNTMCESLTARDNFCLLFSKRSAASKLYQPYGI